MNQYQPGTNPSGLALGGCGGCVRRPSRTAPTPPPSRLSKGRNLDRKAHPLFWFALILASAAALCFLANAVHVRTRLDLIDIGLFLLTAAWIVQLVFITGAHITT